MKALILAAGLGSRLKHKTIHIPKAMVEVNSKPIISWQIEALKANGVVDIGVVLGYKSEVLKEYLLDNHPEINFNFFINTEYNTSNSAYSFYMAKDYISSNTYLHFNCDILFSKELLKRVIDLDKENVIAVSKSVQLTDNMEQIELADNNKINKMDNMKFDSAVGKAYGVAKLSTNSTQYILEKIENHIKEGDKNQNYYGIIRKAIEDLDYYAVECNSDEILLEVNTLTDHEVVSKKV